MITFHLFLQNSAFKEKLFPPSCAIISQPLMITTKKTSSIILSDHYKIELWGKRTMIHHSMIIDGNSEQGLTTYHFQCFYIIFIYLLYMLTTIFMMIVFLISLRERPFNLKCQLYSFLLITMGELVMVPDIVWSELSNDFRNLNNPVVTFCFV